MSGGDDSIYAEVVVRLVFFEVPLLVAPHLPPHKFRVELMQFVDSAILFAADALNGLFAGPFEQFIHIHVGK
jgi:hypothetical protein